MRQNKTKKLSYLPSKHFITICPFITLSIIKYFITFNCYLFPYSVRIRHFAMKEFCNMVSFFSSSPYSMFDFFSFLYPPTELETLSLQLCHPAIVKIKLCFKIFPTSQSKYPRNKTNRAFMQYHWPLRRI